MNQTSLIEDILVSGVIEDKCHYNTEKNIFFIPITLKLKYSNKISSQHNINKVPFIMYVLLVQLKPLPDGQVTTVISKLVNLNQNDTI